MGMSNVFLYAALAGGATMGAGEWRVLAQAERNFQRTMEGD